MNRMSRIPCTRIGVVTGYWLLVTGYWLLVTGYWLLVTGYWLLVIGYIGYWCSNIKV